MVEAGRMLFEGILKYMQNGIVDFFLETAADGGVQQRVQAAVDEGQAVGHRDHNMGH